MALVASGDFFLPLVLALGLLDGALAITGRSITRAAVATLLQPAGLLKEGNALMNIGFALASVGGAALAGLLIAEFGVTTALLVDAASFLAIAIILVATKELPEVHVVREPWRERFGAAMRFARRSPVVRLLLVGQAIALVLFTVVIPIEVIYAKESLGTSDAGFGILLASWGAGIVIGSLVFLLVRQRSPLALIIVSTALIGIAYLGMATADTLLVACLISAVGGAGNGVQWISVVTALQEMTPADYQARIVSMLESLGAAMPGIGYLLGGVLTAIGSPRTAYAVAGAGVLVLVLGAMILRPSLDRPPAARRHRAGEIPLPEPLGPAPKLEPTARKAN
jgi:predicted MFS family arabinose efflux permease